MAIFWSEPDGIESRMIAKTDAHDQAKKKINLDLNKKTMHAYSNPATKQARKKDLNDMQKNQIRKEVDEANRKLKAALSRMGSEIREINYQSIEDKIQQAGQEIAEMHAQVTARSVENPIQYAKIKRIGEAHMNKAAEYRNKFRQEVQKMTKGKNFSTFDGLEHR